MGSGSRPGVPNQYRGNAVKCANLVTNRQKCIEVIALEVFLLGNMKKIIGVPVGGVGGGTRGRGSNMLNITIFINSDAKSIIYQ